MIRRQGPPVHEVMRSKHEPSVIAAAAELVARLGRLEAELATSPHPVCGPASASSARFTPARSTTSTLRRPGSKEPGAGCRGPTQRPSSANSSAALDRLAADTRHDHHMRLVLYPRCVRARSGRSIGGVVSALPSSDLGITICPPVPSRLSTTATASAASAACRRSRTARAGGQHTVSEWVEIDDLVRVAWLYAATALDFCNPPPE